MANRNPNLSNLGKNTAAVNVPPGRTLADIPKGEPIPPPDNVAKPRNSRLTLRELVTEGESKNYLIPFLMDMASKRKKGPWREYLSFYTENLSGDVDSMSPEVRAKVEKMVKELNDAYFEAQAL